MIQENIRKEILKKLHDAEDEHSVRILYACESGSRAWGFESPDSDYDVRFIYVNRSDWYLTFDVEHKRDVIEYPIVDEIDCGGWDVRKALYLFTRTNGALLEWLTSPIKYIEVGELANSLRELAPVCFNKTSLCYHYSHMARGNVKKYLFSDRVKLKKYFYFLRPLLAIRYIEATNNPPPVEFEMLVKSCAPYEIREGIDYLLKLKRNTPEMGYGKPVPEINRFINTELDRHGESFKGQGRPDLLDKKDAIDKLNELFKSIVLNE